MAETESNFTTSNQIPDAKRAAGRYLVPFKYELNGGTGYVTWHCRIEEVDELGNVMHGPAQLHGVDTPHLNRYHDGEHLNFLLDNVKPKMMAHYDAFKHDHSDAIDLEGKSL